MRSILETLGVEAELAQSIWPAPVAEGGVVNHKNAIGVQDPRARMMLEAAVGRVLRAQRGGEQPGADDVEVIQGVLLRFGTSALTLTTERAA